MFATFLVGWVTGVTCGSVVCFACFVFARRQRRDDEIIWCRECGDGMTTHDPGICGCCYDTKYAKDPAPSSTIDTKT